MQNATGPVAITTYRSAHGDRFQVAWCCLGKFGGKRLIAKGIAPAMLMRIAELRD
jgi:hypothetical protein